MKTKIFQVSQIGGSPKFVRKTQRKKEGPREEIIWVKDSLMAGPNGEDPAAWIRGDEPGVDEPRYWIRIDGGDPTVVVEIRRKILAALQSEKVETK